jgi:20S proteasome alpha/beta subunit
MQLENTQNSLYKKRASRYLSEPRLTLIIAFRCDEGVAIVSDRKMTDLQNGESSFDQKIFFPILGAPFIVGAAGFRDLFREFNTKLPNRVNERLAEYDLKNIKALTESGCTYEQALKYIEAAKPQPTTTQAIEFGKKVDRQKKKVAVPIPYVYTYEHLMDDCKEIINKISKPYLSRGYPLELLVAVKKDNNAPPTIHQIDCQGFENQIDEYSAIGTGAPHARGIFGRFYKKEKPMLELVTLAYLTIAYSQDIAKETSVGYNDKYPPQAFAILNDGSTGEWTIQNQLEVLNSIEVVMAEMGKHVEDIWRKTIKLRVS